MSGIRTASVVLVARVALASVALFASGCGSAPPPPPAALEPAPPPPPPPAGAMAVTSELGSIDEDATEGTFRRMEHPLQSCHRQGMRRVRYLAGDVQLFVRVGQDGAVKYAFLETSTLGDRETERCMLDAIARAEWPKPRGGEAEVRKKIGFDPPPDVRKPVDWPSDKVAAVLNAFGAEARKCKSRSDGTYLVTMYIVPKGKNGRAQAVGVSPPNAEADANVDCIVKALKAITMPKPGKFPAKVSFVF